MKKILMRFSAVLLVSIFLTACISEPTSPPDPADPIDPAEETGITVTTPEEGESVTFPLTITGEATGLWFFEAIMPVTLLDNDGNVLVQTYVEAQDSWMTEDFVPFEGVIESVPEGSEGGILLFEEANPADLSEIGRDIWTFEVPIVF
jgi:hypothetical protein